MDELLLDIIDAVRKQGVLGQKALDQIVRRHNRGHGPGERMFSKKRLYPHYLDVKANDPATWRSWDIDQRTEQLLAQTLRMKPRRTASGVATISVLTKPWPCSGACVYCPNDVRMPKSYLADEPACQRAERCFFDPYLQVWSRIRALQQMGHPLDKVELIILGGTWNDYPRDYRIWFVEELFRALNDSGQGDGRHADAEARKRRNLYRARGLLSDPAKLAARYASAQQRIDAHVLGYNQAVAELYAGPWKDLEREQRATLEQLREQHRVNEQAARRVVGLVIETRPGSIDCDSLTLMRQLGCTKVQIGVQSTEQQVLDATGRGIGVDHIARAFDLLRLFGFKVHAHYMVNLPGATPHSDIESYRAFMDDPRFRPDEVKIYPCALVQSSGLDVLFEQGGWKPYAEGQLVEVLVADTLATPAYARISRMIRDIPSNDIKAGNKKTNLRQLVEAGMGEARRDIREIRYREVATQEVDVQALRLDELSYACVSSDERFLQWVDDHGRIAGFLRLSLPKRCAQDTYGWQLPVGSDQAMIREVHIYGRAERIGDQGGDEGEGGAQHRGLGRMLVHHACHIAREAGYARINVISSVGTRAYYRSLGFADGPLYQHLDLS